jgi:hypothetical protein
MHVIYRLPNFTTGLLSRPEEDAIHRIRGKDHKKLIFRA